MSILTEGINDKYIFKAVFVVGAPGSGKDWIVSKTVMGHGLKEINSDQAFEYLSHKSGLDLSNMANHGPNDVAVRDAIRKRAKKTTHNKRSLYIKGRLGLLINGTGADYSSINVLNRTLKGLGYDTMMIYVNVTDNISKERNIFRGTTSSIMRSIVTVNNKRKVKKTKVKNRSIPEYIRKDKWSGVHENIGRFQSMFGAKNFYVIDNNKDLRNAPEEVKQEAEKNFLRVYKGVGKFLNSPVKNQLHKKWIRDEQKMRGIKEEENPKYSKKTKKLRTGKITYGSTDNADAISTTAGAGQMSSAFYRLGESALKEVLPIKRK